MDIFITFDLDNISCNNAHYENNNLSFEYEKELIKLYDFFHKSEINCFTAFARIDKQIKQVFGDYLHVFNNFPRPDILHEIGWHPHLYYKSGNRYYPEHDTWKTIDDLWEIYHSCVEVRSMKSVRMGGSIMSNSIMATLSSMNFQFDSSAMPGCFRHDIKRNYDWTYTGNTPYYPFINDYQCSGSHHHTVFEVPMTTLVIPAPYDLYAKRRYINPTINKDIFQPAFANQSSLLTSLVVTFHPDQLISGYSDDLYEYGLDNFINNMEFIISEFDEVTYKTISCAK